MNFTIIGLIVELIILFNFRKIKKLVPIPLSSAPELITISRKDRLHQHSCQIPADS